MADVKIKDLVDDVLVTAYLDAADKNFAAMGYKEHGLRHARLASRIAGVVLEKLGYSERETELGRIAGYLHDIGNSIDQGQHSFSGGIMAKRILERLNCDHKEIMTIVTAVGAHEEKELLPNSPVTAAVIFGDKADVSYTRVRTQKFTELDKHAKVNLACESSELLIDARQKTISLELEIDTDIANIGEYFEIFLERMLQLKKAAKFFDYSFILFINEEKFL
jgi:hypothetical protein